MSKPLGVVIHFDHGNAITQYLGWSFNSMARIGGSYFGAGPDGLYRIGGDNDAGEEITATVKTPLMDAGSAQQKRIRRVWLQGDLQAGGTLTTVSEAGEEREYDVPAQDAGQAMARVPVGRDGTSRHWQLRFDNVGGDFALEGMDIDFAALGRRR